MMLVALTGLATLTCRSGPSTEAPSVALDYERFVLDNGLEVVLHVDESDPIAAVAMTFHVGSAREVEGRTGFAHLFEHLFFLDSENLGPGGLDRLMTRVGSSTNGSTSRDRTNYFEVVPIDGLEKTLWAEADKLGFFINTMTESTVAKERQVVKNEKRQGVDNQPYGHTNYVIDRALYPGGHPYRWQVIGSLADLDAASAEDVRAFHARWYGPNNATLVVAGDLDVEETRAWIEKYFGEIPARPTPERDEVPDVVLDGDKLLFHEDNYARLPALTLAWPTVPRFHPDEYALDVLAELLTSGRSTPFYEVVVEEDQLAPNVAAGHGTQELAGRFALTATAYAGTDLDELRASFARAFARFESEGVVPQELQRVKAGTEIGFYRRLASTLGKANQLADYAIFAGDPGFADTDLERTLGVTAEDVMRVYTTYIADRPLVATSFVPRGAPALALEGSARAEVVEEPIVVDAGDEAPAVVRGERTTPAGAFDRSVEPPFGARPELTAPVVDRAQLSNGVPVLSIQDPEIPLIQLEIRLKGGMLLEETAKLGVSQLLAQSMTEGTAGRTPEELEQAIDLLGASIDVSAGPEDFVISASTLARNFEETVALVEEILLEPRYDVEAFELAKQRTLNALEARAAQPNAIAGDVFRALLYDDHILAGNPLGTPETVESTTLDDLRAYHAHALVPELASIHVAGDVSPEDIAEAMAALAERWVPADEVPVLPGAPQWSAERAGLYFVDVPGASQSVLRIGYLALAASDDLYWPATVMNFRLGGGGFASDLTQELREGRGYTYGIGSGFSGSELPGPFQIASGVRSNVTSEALQLIKDIVEGFGPTYDAADLEATQSYLLRTNARAFETLGAKLGVLRDVSAYGLEPDYLLRREQVVRDMTVEGIRELADRFLDAEAMIWLVVGDARTQLPRVGALGLGDAVLLDREGRRVAVP